MINTKQKPKARILSLEGCAKADRLFMESLRPDLEIELVNPIDELSGEADRLPISERYYWTEDSEVEAIVRRLTRKEHFDLVIIGNNKGAGLRKAACVKPSMRAASVVILWNSFGYRDTKPYENMGYTHFCTRDQYSKFLECCLTRKFGEVKREK